MSARQGGGHAFICVHLRRGGTLAMRENPRSCRTLASKCPATRPAMLDLSDNARWRHHSRQQTALRVAWWERRRREAPSSSSPAWPRRGRIVDVLTRMPARARDRNHMQATAWVWQTWRRSSATIGELREGKKRGNKCLRALRSLECPC
jgi:hypothetical protein